MWSYVNLFFTHPNKITKGQFFVPNHTRFQLKFALCGYSFLNSNERWNEFMKKTEVKFLTCDRKSNKNPVMHNTASDRVISLYLHVRSTLNIFQSIQLILLPHPTWSVDLFFQSNFYAFFFHLRVLQINDSVGEKFQ